MASEVTRAEEAGELGSDKGSSEQEGSRSRRHILKALGAAVAGGLAGAVMSPKQALAHGGFHQDFNGVDPAIHGNNLNGGPGVEGTSATGAGVRGEGAVGVIGEGASVGLSGQGSTGVVGEGFVGVEAHGTSSGVFALSEDGRAVHGQTSTGVGLSALSPSTGTGVALLVRGKAKFSTAGSGVIPRGEDSGEIQSLSITPESHITVTFTGNPGVPLAGFPVSVLWVERFPGLKAIIHLTRSVGRDTPFTYLIVDPG